ncbi:response regulator transcription factor [Bacillus kexueae]|uniref:response regulator transcription factor n=1 Tax=Aeribacillus kexueae TaxID=2078952 RepID=UPI001FAE75CA|nr:response regulator transcription factor [Bacillus kexueae]
MGFRIHLVEDEKHLHLILKGYLEKEGYEVLSFFDGHSAIEAVYGEKPHLWVLDIMLPDIDGYQLIKEIKKDNQDVPVIFISARDADLDRILGLELGSDDYLAKPFLPKELVIRCQKILKRVYPEQAKLIHYAMYQLDEEKRIVLQDGEPVLLTAKEYELFALFVKNIGRAYSREEILTLIWGQDYFGSDRVVDDLVRRLRKKMAKLRLETVYGYGYRLIEAD